jgi:VCBS repeat-containing protein
MGKVPSIAAGPSSNNDTYVLSEDWSGTYFNVLANDAKTGRLYSLDNNNVSDLLTQDRVDYSEVSQLGASVWITADGRVGYSPGLQNSQFQSLAAGESVQDSFLYAVQLGNGSLVWSTVRVTITGANDAPVANADTGLGKEDSITTGSVATNDSDVDHGAVLHYAIAGQGLAGFSMASDGSWSFDASNPAYQSLSEGYQVQSLVQYTVTDEHGESSSSYLTLTITGTNDAPRVTGVVAGGASEDGAPMSLDALANASDADSGSTLSVVNVPAAADLPAGVTYNAATHSFTLDPANAAYQQLAQGQTSVVTVAYGVSDGRVTTAASVSWTVTGTNDAPVAAAATAGVLEDATVSGQLAASDADRGAALTFALIGDAPAGFSLTAGGSWAFDASQAGYQALAQGDVRTFAVTYSVTDEHGASSNSTLNLNLTGTNDTPVAAAATAGVLEDATVSGQLAASDADNGAALTYALIGDAPSGFALSSDGNWSFDASQADLQRLAEGETRDVTVAYQVTDEHGASSTSTLTLTVTGANDAPVASPGAAAVNEDASTSGQLAATDPDKGAQLNYALAGDAAAGFALAADGSWTFDANQTEYQALALGENREITVNYTVADERGASSASSLVLTLTGANDAPVATSTAAQVAEGDTVSGQLFAMDQDNGAQLSFALTGEPPAGFAVTPDGNWTFDAANHAYEGLGVGEVQIVAVPFVVTDEHGAAASSFLTIAVTGANDAPALTGTPATLPNGTEDTAYVLTQDQLLAGWADPDGDALSASGLTAANATVTANPDGSFTLTPAANFNGDIQVSYIVSDGAASVQADATLALQAVNDAPVLASTGTTLPSSMEDTSFVLTQQQLLAGWTDVEGDTLTAAGLSATNATVNANADGSFTVTPATNFNGQLQLGYVVSDGVASVNAGATLAIQAVNDAPVLTGTATTLPNGTEDLSFVVTQQQLLAGWGDADGDSLQVVGLQADHAAVTANGDGSWSILPSADYNGPLTLSYNVSDGFAAGSASLSLVLAPVNDAPVLTGSPAILPAGTEDSTVTLTRAQLLQGWSDAEGDALTITNLVASNGARVTANANGTYYVTPAANWNGVLQLSYGVSDGTAATAANLSLSFTAANDLPWRTGTVYAIPGQVEDTPFTLTAAQLLQGWTDADGDSLSIWTISTPGGLVTNNGDGTFTIHPAANATGTARLDYSVFDGHFPTVSTSLNYTLQAVNDPAVISGTTGGTAAEDAFYSDIWGGLSSTDVDNPANSFIAASSTATTYGSYSFTAQGRWTYYLNNANPAVNGLDDGQTLTDSFVVRTVDGTQQTITVTIQGLTDNAYVSPAVSTAADANDFDQLNAAGTQGATLYNFYGTSAGETVDGSNGNDGLSGQGGADVIYGHGGSDGIYGEIPPSNAPPLSGVAGDDLLYGQAGNDGLYGGLGNDRLYGGSGNDTLYGNHSQDTGTDTGSDWLYGGSGNDTLYGQSGDDVLVGGTGFDQLTGGAGADRFVYLGAQDTGDWIWDFQRGTDHIDLSALGLDPAKFVGATAPGYVGPGEVGFRTYMGGAQVDTYIYVDTDGVAGADLEIHLIGTNGVAAGDFIW